MNTKGTKSLAVLTLVPLLTVTLVGAAQQTRQNDQQNKPLQRQTPQRELSRNTANQQQNLQFVTFDKMKGLDVRSLSEETLGEVDDLVIECRSGRVAYVLLNYGGTLGVGQKTKAVPYSAFQFNGRDDDGISLRLDLVKSDLDAAPEFDAAAWSTANQQTWDEKLGEYWNSFVDSFDKDEPKSWRDAVSTGEKRTIDGKIVKVIRLEDTRPERVALLVETESGEMQTVYLGPSWWVLSQDPAPAQGKKITITAYPVKDDRNPTVVATSIRISNGKTIVLRQDDGRPSWRESNQADDAERSATADNMSTTSARYCLVSDLVNAPVTAQGADAGHIDAVYVECTTGQVAFLGIDPDEKLADIGEVNRIIPFELESMSSDNKISLWTDTTLLTNGMEMPKNADELNRAAYRTQVYNHYGVNERTFKSHNMRNHDDNWDRSVKTEKENREGAATAQSDLRVALLTGDPVSFDGEVVRVMNDASADAYLGNMAIVVRTNDGEQTICIGPTRVFNEINLKPGQIVTGKAIRAKVNGKTMYIARSVMVDGKSHDLRDTSGKPNWDVR